MNQSTNEPNIIKVLRSPLAEPHLIRQPLDDIEWLNCIIYSINEELEAIEQGHVVDEKSITLLTFAKVLDLTEEDLLNALKEYIELERVRSPYPEVHFGKLRDALTAIPAKLKLETTCEQFEGGGEGGAEDVTIVFKDVLSGRLFRYYGDYYSYDGYTMDISTVHEVEAYEKVITAYRPIGSND